MTVRTASSACTDAVSPVYFRFVSVGVETTARLSRIYSSETVTVRCPPYIAWTEIRERRPRSAYR